MGLVEPRKDIPACRRGELDSWIFVAYFLFLQSSCVKDAELKEKILLGLDPRLISANGWIRKDIEANILLFNKTRRKVSTTKTRIRKDQREDGIVFIFVIRLKEKSSFSYIAVR